MVISNLSSLSVLQNQGKEEYDLENICLIWEDIQIGLGNGLNKRDTELIEVSKV